MKHNNLYEIKDPEGIVHCDDIGKANLLNEYFTSVFTVDTDFEGCTTLENSIGSIYFTPKAILILVNKLNCSKAAGPDGIHSKIIQECSDIFSLMFYSIFHKSIKKIPYLNSGKKVQLEHCTKKGRGMYVQTIDQ